MDTVHNSTTRNMVTLQNFQVICNIFDVHKTSKIYLNNKIKRTYYYYYYY